jgi:hypothetical protein
MDNDTYDDRNYTQQKFNKNIVKRIQELEDRRPSKLDDQVDIKLMKQEEWNEKVIERLDQEIENRTRAFEQIEDLEDLVAELKFDIETKLERIENILVVHRNQDRTQKKNYKALRDVWDKTVLNIIEKGEHGKH